MASADFKRKVFERFKKLRETGKWPQYAIEIEDSEGFKIPMILTYEEVETDEILMKTLDEEFKESSEKIEDYMGD